MNVVRLALADYSAIYAVGDIHGCASELELACHHIERDASAIVGRKLVVFLGDYIDRGPHSKAVIEMLAQPAPDGVERVCLIGNHERKFLNFIENPRLHSDWLDIGGDNTLRSYGIDISRVLTRRSGWDKLRHVMNEMIPASHFEFIRGLPSLLQMGSLVFVHAGVRPGVVIPEQTERDLITIREPFLSEGPMLPIFVVHGHTIVGTPTLGPRRIGIDTGAFLSGRLTVMRVFEGKILCYLIQR